MFIKKGVEIFNGLWTNEKGSVMNLAANMSGTIDGFLVLLDKLTGKYLRYPIVGRFYEDLICLIITTAHLGRLYTYAGQLSTLGDDYFLIGSWDVNIDMLKNDDLEATEQEFCSQKFKKVKDYFAD